jgi:hypothetical protein
MALPRNVRAHVLFVSLTDIPLHADSRMFRAYCGALVAEGDCFVRGAEAALKERAACAPDANALCPACMLRIDLVQDAMVRTTQILSASPRLAVLLRRRPWWRRLSFWLSWWVFWLGLPLLLWSLWELLR